MTPTARVIDLSHHNTVGASDFKAMAAAGLWGVVHKATQGTVYIDHKFDERREAARAAGLLFGAYHFGTNDPVDAQVDHFLSATSAKHDDKLMIALDHEENHAQTMNLEAARAFLQAIERLLGRPAWYYGGSLLKGILHDKVDSYFGQHQLWLPQYGPTPHPQKSFSRVALWQFTDKGTVQGVAGTFDLNHYDGDRAALENEWALRHTPAPKVADVGPAVGTVKWVQQSLNTLGATPRLTDDGLFGEKTRKAVDDFRMRENIEAGADVNARIELRLTEKLTATAQAKPDADLAELAEAREILAAAIVPPAPDPRSATPATLKRDDAQ